MKTRKHSSLRNFVLHLKVDGVDATPTGGDVAVHVYITVGCPAHVLAALAAGYAIAATVQNWDGVEMDSLPEVGETDAADDKAVVTVSFYLVGLTAAGSLTTRLASFVQDSSVLRSMDSLLF